MSLRQGQRYVRVDVFRINHYLYDHVKTVKKETVVGASVEGDEVVFLVEKIEDGQEGS